MLDVRNVPNGMEVGGGLGGNREYLIVKVERGLEVVKLENDREVGRRLVSKRAGADALELAIFIGIEWLEG